MSCERESLQTLFARTFPGFEAEKSVAPLSMVGSATDNLCVRPATEYVNHNTDETPDMCIVHALLVRVDELAIALGAVRSAFSACERELR